MTGSNDIRIIGLDPTPPRRIVSPSSWRATRPSTLDGAAVGLLSNTKGCATALLDAIYAELGSLAAIGPAVRIAKPGFSVPPTPEQWTELTSTATVAVVALGA